MNPADELCLGCMEPLRGHAVCSHCGWRQGHGAAEPEQLRPGACLAGKYLVGRALGQGGFGITYLAWDLVLSRKVAVKEYFPAQFCIRDPHSTVIPSRTAARDSYESGREKFLEEGRILARLDHPSIVDVLDYFEENGTAYLAMKYLEGETLAAHLKRVNRLPFDTALAVLSPVMDALREAHRIGLLHRDVSPDNIFLSSSGQVKLFDFGAARAYLTGYSQNLTTILKQGYAPLEQYQSQGQGPWTDVYGVAATTYHALSGHIPPPAPERIQRDELRPPSSLDVRIPSAAERALLKGLAVKSADRFQDIPSFQQALNQVPVADPGAGKKPSASLAWGITGALVVIVIGLLVLFRISSGGSGETPSSGAAARKPDSGGASVSSDSGASGGSASKVKPSQDTDRSSEPTRPANPFSTAATAWQVTGVANGVPIGWVFHIYPGSTVRANTATDDGFLGQGNWRYDASQQSLEVNGFNVVFNSTFRCVFDVNERDPRHMKGNCRDSDGNAYGVEASER